jgi:diaminohydroxyphosphoribosylaminopyrimidine deaminase/5-amino-6-(5-phosphoribosylamino)uracil reductase
MTNHHDSDQQYMAQALKLAEQGLYTASPNPRVGCVLVKEAELIGSGFHAKAGEPHAEINALRSVKDSVSVIGATAYVTLEPCSHQGKTPPCCNALIEAGVARVVIAMQDPNPLVAGKGIAALKAAGIDVETGLLEVQARALNPGFIKRMETGLPWVRLKLAMSLDGRTAMASGESQWITGPEARQQVQRLRAQSCAIVTGIDTVLVDDPSLTVRADELGLENAEAISQQQPLRVVLDSSLRIEPTAKLLSQVGRTLIVSKQPGLAAEAALLEAGAKIDYAAGENGQIDLISVLKILAAKDCNEVLFETGATLAGALLQADLVDELIIFMAPDLLGSSARPLMDFTIDKMSDKKQLHIDSIFPVGRDWRINARLIPADKQPKTT